MSDLKLRFRGALASLNPDDLAALFDRRVEGASEIRESVRRIIEEVRTSGDAALVDLARTFDGVALESIEVPAVRCYAALDRLPAGVRKALERSVRNLTTTHARWRPRASEVETEPGVLVGRRPDPVDRLGAYVPGGRAAYPSSVLMTAVPARVAGVGEVVVCSPPGPDGVPPELVLAACALTGVDRVFAIGGAGAIAAMAYGTPSVPRVDRIVGPGNAYVMEAKLQMANRVAIDAPAGPSELLIVADASTGAEVVVREMIAQAEHDTRAAVVAVVIGPSTLAAEVEGLLVAAIEASERGEIVRTALATAGGLLVSESIDEVIDFANRYAAEHLMLALSGGFALRNRVRNAGSVFLGPSSSVAFGDYITGANHVLPTGGLARAYSGLVPEDFVRWTTYQRVTPRAAASLAADAALLATAEGLPGHAAAARAWERSNA